jgi:uncharacterized membrane protein YhaH (DUF805 family)
LDQRARKSRWPARLDVVQSASGLFLGYVSRKDFWTLGLIFGAIYLAILLVIGVPYLRFYLG